LPGSSCAWRHAAAVGHNFAAPLGHSETPARQYRRPRVADFIAHLASDSAPARLVPPNFRLLMRTKAACDAFLGETIGRVRLARRNAAASIRRRRARAQRSGFARGLLEAALLTKEQRIEAELLYQRAVADARDASIEICLRVCAEVLGAEL